MEESLNLLETLAEFKDFKSIDRESLMRILEDIFRSALTKKYGPDANFEVIVNVDRGEMEIQRYREIVEDDEVKNEFTQIALSEAIKIEPDFEVGEEVMENVRFRDFARREIQALRQNLINKIMEYEKDIIYKKYEHRIGELVSGEVNQV
jgi:N utilization substance protein A